MKNLNENIIDIKSIIEIVEFEEINSLLLEFDNESEKLEFNSILESYKHHVLSDKEKQKEVKLKIIRYLSETPFLSDKREDFNLKIPLLTGKKLEDLKRFYKEDKEFLLDLNLSQIDSKIKNFGIKEKEEIFLLLQMIKKEEYKKEEIEFDLEYSYLPIKLKLALFSKSKLSIKEILDDKIVYSIKFKKSLNFKDYYNLLKEIENYEENPLSNSVKKLFSESAVKTYKYLKKYGINNLEDIKSTLIFQEFDRDIEKKLYEEFLYKELTSSRDLKTYLDDIYTIGVKYYKREHPKVKFNDLEDIVENLKNEKRVIKELKKAVLIGIKDNNLIDSSSNIEVAKQKIKDIFKKHGEEDELLIDKFINENTKNNQVLEEEKAEQIKNRIYFYEIDKRYKTRKKTLNS